jgi:hypothetical protein
VFDKIYKIYLKGEDKTDNVSGYRRVGDKFAVTFSNRKLFTYIKRFAKNSRGRMSYPR